MRRPTYRKGDRVVRTERIREGEGTRELRAVGRVTGVDRNGVEITFDDTKLGKAWVPLRLVSPEGPIVETKPSSDRLVIGKVPVPANALGPLVKKGAPPLVGMMQTVSQHLPPAPAIMELPPPKSYDEMQTAAKTAVATVLSSLQDEVQALRDMAKSLVTKAEHAVLEAKRDRERKRQEVNEAQAALVEAEALVAQRERELQQVMQYAGAKS